MVEANGIAAGRRPEPLPDTTNRYLITTCPRCHTQFPQVVVTGAVQRALFDFQQGQARGRAVFNVEQHGHEEAEVRCLGCKGRFWSISPRAVADAHALNDAIGDWVAALQKNGASDAEIARGLKL